VECLETLKGRGPADLETLSLLLAARMLHLSGATATLEEAKARTHAALTSGRGLDKFRHIIEHQGGDPRVVDDYSRLPAAPQRTLFRAERSGYVAALDAELVGRATMLLGAGRDRVEDVIDPGVGAVVLAPCGSEVRAGDALVELHYREASRLEAALELLRRACVLAEAPPAPQPLLLETIG
jgi:thymidine phosphorylase